MQVCILVCFLFITCHFVYKSVESVSITVESFVASAFRKVPWLPFPELSPVFPTIHLDVDWSAHPIYNYPSSLLMSQNFRMDSFSRRRKFLNNLLLLKFIHSTQPFRLSPSTLVCSLPLAGATHL